MFSSFISKTHEPGILSWNEFQIGGHENSISARVLSEDMSELYSSIVWDKDRWPYQQPCTKYSHYMIHIRYVLYGKSIIVDLVYLHDNENTWPDLTWSMGQIWNPWPSVHHNSACHADSGRLCDDEAFSCQGCPHLRCYKQILFINKPTTTTFNSQQQQQKQQQHVKI